MKTVPDFMHLRVKWSRFAQFGIAQSILGVLALGTMNVSTTGTVMLFGWLLLVNGVVEAVQAFQSRKPITFFLHVVPGIAIAPICLLIATRLGANELAWTILFGSIFMVVGLFRITVALAYRFPGWGWTTLDGGVTFLLASLLWAAWPWWASWFFGFALGASLVLQGWSSITFALALRSNHPHGRPHLRAA
jgi:uncharacterized membrane protein HdeD (DUF308 family)